MPITFSLRPARTRIAAVCIGALAATGIALVNAGGATADDYPGQAEIEAARQATASQAATVDQLDAAVAQLEKAQHDAEAAQLIAADKYAQAQGALEDAQTNLATARERADEADAALADAQSKLAVVAQAAYRDGGDMGEVEAVVTANGFEQAITQSEAMGRASDEMATLVQRVEAAKLVAETMRKAADDAAVKAEAAETDAAAAYDDATAAADAAEQAVKESDAVRDEAVKLLAELQGTTVALESARQQGLAEARNKKKEAAAKAAQEQAEKDAQNGSGGKGGSNSGGSNSGGSNSGGSNSGGSNSGGSNSGGSNSGGSNSGGSNEPSTPTKTEDPEPPPPASGGWKSTAAQGEKAVTKALTLMGLPYKLGGTGPSSFDCSGLTMVSWKAAGISIQRSSQMQYNSMKHVPFSQLRKGDLIFYGDNRNASKIYHVTIYIGGGMVAEATSPGNLSQVRPYDAFWRVDDLIPLAGRP